MPFQEIFPLVLAAAEGEGAYDGVLGDGGRAVLRNEPSTVMVIAVRGELERWIDCFGHLVVIIR